MAHYLREDLYFSVVVTDNELRVLLGDMELWSRSVSPNATREDSLEKEKQYIAWVFEQLNGHFEKL